MTDHDAPAHAADTAHHADEHDAGHDEHGHDTDTIGPIDWPMWGVGILGVISALIVVAGFVVATQFVFLDLVA